MNFNPNGKVYVKRTVNECWNLLSSALHGISLGPEEVMDVIKVFGRRLTSDIVSPVNIPSYRASIVDGFAIASSILLHDQSLRVVGCSYAGTESSCPDLSQSEAVYVTTGGPVPSNTCAVIPIEYCSVDGQGMRVLSDYNSDRVSNVREVGSDTAVGSVIVPGGKVIGPGELSVLFAAKVQAVTVFRRLRVGVLSTGGEVASGHIGDANRAYLLSRLREYSDFSHLVEVFDLGAVLDDADVFEKILLSSDHDVLVTTGSLSKGKTDFMKPVLENLGFNILFGQVDLKPGKPTTAALGREGKVIFCLPGNPASCFVTFNLFVIPSLLRLSGGPWSPPIATKVIVSEQLTLLPDAERPEFLRAQITLNPAGGISLANLIAGHHRSSRAASCSGDVNGLIRVEPGPTAIVTSGRLFDCYLLPGCCVSVNPVSPLAPGPVTQEAKAKAFDSLVEWLKVRNDVENIELMNLAGFCRNCLSNWLHAGMGGAGSISDAKTYVYGMDYDEWKKLYRKGEKRDHAPPSVPVVNTPSVTHSNPCASSLMKSSVSQLAGRACILTVSDRAYAGVYPDESGPAISAILQKEGMQVSQPRIVPDVLEEIRNAVMEWVSEPTSAPDLIITTGGTGFTQRDVTPEALEKVIEKKASGLSHLLLSSFVKQDPLFALTRLTAGTVGRTLVISLPGRPSAVREGVHVLLPVLPKILLDLAR